MACLHTLDRWERLKNILIFLAFLRLSWKTLLKSDLRRHPRIHQRHFNEISFPDRRLCFFLHINVSVDARTARHGYIILTSRKPAATDSCVESKNKLKHFLLYLRLNSFILSRWRRRVFDLFIKHWMRVPHSIALNFTRRWGLVSFVHCDNAANDGNHSVDLRRQLSHNLGKVEMFIYHMKRR